MAAILAECNVYQIPGLSQAAFSVFSLPLPITLFPSSVSEELPVE